MQPDTSTDAKLNAWDERNAALYEESCKDMEAPPEWPDELPADPTHDKPKGRRR